MRQPGNRAGQVNHSRLRIKHRAPQCKHKTCSTTLPTLPREEHRGAPGEPPSSHSAEAPGRCSDDSTGPAGSSLCWSRSSHGPRDLRPWDTSLLKQRQSQGAQAPASSHQESE
ncbi:hypothetical protein CHARACLAT_007842 [Characodon lateralis]|uniref:Uncharacterized protein n=1 Tax=Characodon lateralis TaxID=208331 RepID=A0ABU7F3M4_9TELE|nr:hypothetical protein [Characodon lateralis]